VHFPTILDLQPYVGRARSKKGSNETNGAKNGDAEKGASPRPLYELSSVIVHKGKMDSGHYVSYAREGDEWFLFDDSKVVLVEEKEVLAAEAYMLFYIVQEIEV
jgi:ubiquitin carboxyl-terminal hydrolase 22/27/51